MEKEIFIKSNKIINLSIDANIGIKYSNIKSILFIKTFYYFYEVIFVLLFFYAKIMK
jgi:hypothetical protein